MFDEAEEQASGKMIVTDLRVISTAYHWSDTAMHMTDDNTLFTYMNGDDHTANNATGELQDTQATTTMAGASDNLQAVEEIGNENNQTKGVEKKSRPIVKSHFSPISHRLRKKPF